MSDNLTSFNRVCRLVFEGYSRAGMDFPNDTAWAMFMWKKLSEANAFSQEADKELVALRDHAERLAEASDLLKQAQFAIDLMRPLVATSLTHEAYSNIRVLREEIEDCLTALTLYRAENPKV